MVSIGHINTNSFLSCRSVKEGWWAEFAAMRIPANHKYTYQLIKEFNIREHVFIDDNSHKNYFLSGKRMSGDKYKTREGREFLYKIYEVKRNETKIPPEDYLDHLFEEPGKDLGRLSWKQFVEKYDKHSIKSYMTKHGVSFGMQELIDITTNLESITQIGLVEFIIDECLFQQR